MSRPAPRRQRVFEIDCPWCPPDADDAPSPLTIFYDPPETGEVPTLTAVDGEPPCPHGVGSRVDFLSVEHHALLVAEAAEEWRAR